MEFIEGNDDDHGYEDMVLMSLCKHHIIANSSFSFFGAWISEGMYTGGGGLTFSPDKYHTEEVISAPYYRIPKNWIVLKI